MRIDELSIIIISSVGALASQCAGTNKKFIIINDLQVSSYTLMTNATCATGLRISEAGFKTFLTPLKTNIKCNVD